jgi:hypothetical protein
MINTKKLITWMMVLLLTLQIVSALGIRPAKTTLMAEEGLDYSDVFWVVNNDARGFSVKIYVEGEMGQYVKLETDKLDFRSDDGAKAINFEIELPKNVPPGVSTANIVIEENIGGSNNNVVSSKVVMKHKIIIQGEYPEKYITAKLNFHDKEDHIEFVSEVENLGQKNIDNVITTFYVNDKLHDQHKIESEQTSLNAKENKLLTQKMEKDLFELGEFEVSAITTYDDQIIETVKKMIVGKPDIDIAYFDQYFMANEINKYTMDLLNNWNKKIENVFVQVLVSKDNQKVDEFRTKSVEIEGKMIKRLQDYFNAKDDDQGKYKFDLIVNFWNINNNVEQKEFTFEGELLSKN